jgi:tRNA-guanine family transglycosylase
MGFLPHGTVETPMFMPVGTQGSVKTLHPEELELLGAKSSSATPTTCGCGPATS